mgnify:CR=1 FL=1
MSVISTYFSGYLTGLTCLCFVLSYSEVKERKPPGPPPGPPPALSDSEEEVETDITGMLTVISPYSA